MIKNPKFESQVAKQFEPLYLCVKEEYDKMTQHELWEAYMNEATRNEATAYLICKNVGLFYKGIRSYEAVSAYSVEQTDIFDEIMLENLVKRMPMWDEKKSSLSHYLKLHFNFALGNYFWGIGNRKGKHAKNGFYTSLDTVIHSDLKGKNDISLVDALADESLSPYEELERKELADAISIISKERLHEIDYEIFQLWLQGYTQREISEVVIISQAHVSRRLKEIFATIKDGLDGKSRNTLSYRPHTQLNHEDAKKLREQVWQYRQQGYKLREIAEMTNQHFTNVGYHLKKKREELEGEKK